MNPLTIIFNSVSTLTGGLINDLTTAIIGVVVLGFIAMGLDHLKYVLDGVTSRRASERYLTKAERAQDASIPWAPGTAQYERQQLLYRRYLNRSVDEAERGAR